jgi:hypothetical protein
LDAGWPLRRHLLLETLRSHPSPRIVLPSRRPRHRAAVIGGNLGPRAAWAIATDGPLINGSPGRHPASSASIHPLPGEHRCRSTLTRLYRYRDRRTSGGGVR